jgi:hypothetical protein
MLNNWLQPLPDNLVEEMGLLNDHQLGRKIASFSKEFPNLESCDVAIIGIGPFANSIRRYLYQMESPFQLSIADLGNLASLTSSGIFPVLQELADSDIIPIVLGGDKELVETQFKSLQNGINRQHPLFVDERIAYGKVLQRSYINNVIEAADDSLRGVTVLGYQRHLSAPEVINKDHDVIFHALRLSQITSDPRSMEPYIRDCTSLSFSINALKKAEAPNKIGFNPSGLSSEDACRICRYAGLNERMSSLLIHDIDMSTEECGQTATLVGQMIWYFLEGVRHRMSEFPIVPEHLTEYLVTSTLWSEPLHFYKSMISGRWWMAHPDHPGSFDEMVPCTYEEYLSACRDEIPERLMTLLS